MRNYYETLGIPPTATLNQIKATYRKLAKDYHPDTCIWGQFGEEAFRNIKEAYDHLSDPTRRALHDTQLRIQAAKTYPQPHQSVFNQQSNNFRDILILLGIYALIKKARL